MSATTATRPRFTRAFLALCLIVVAAFCNVSVFYSFYHYLEAIGVPVIWRGFLVGLEPMAAFLLRLVVLPWLHVRNAYAIVMAALVLLIAVSCSYLWVTTVAGLIALRVLHGAVFVLLTSAAISLLVNLIPPERSGQGFGALSVATMIPYAIIPPLTEYLLPHIRNAADVYAGVSVFSLAGILLILVVRRRILGVVGGMDAALMGRPTMAELRDNFGQRAVVLLLQAILFVYLAHATSFYFLKSLSTKTGAGDVGGFFTVSMLTMIAVRSAGTALFDRLDKSRLLMGALTALVACLIALPGVRSGSAFFLLAALYGGSVGIAIPVLNALLFSASRPALRGLNTNMTLFAMDAGYFLTPYVCGALIAVGADFGLLFYAAASFAFLSLLSIFALRLSSANGGLNESPR